MRKSVSSAYELRSKSFDFSESTTGRLSSGRGNSFRRSRGSSQTKLLDNFLLPPKKRDSKAIQLYRSSSGYSSGDAGKFPFEITPSGNLKVKSQQVTQKTLITPRKIDQVVFASQKLSVSVDDTERTQIKVYSSTDVSLKNQMASDSDEAPENYAMSAILNEVKGGISGLGSFVGDTSTRSRIQESSVYDNKQTSEILEPELSLSRLGYHGLEKIEWSKVTLPRKSDLHGHIAERIKRRINTDCTIQIGDEEIDCHLIVLQCYSEMFNEHNAVRRIQIPEEACSPEIFDFIYEWMINGELSYRRLTQNNVLEVLMAAKYLQIQDLVEQCWAVVDDKEIFTEDSAFILYVDAKRKELEEVREMMVPRIREFFLVLVSSQDWLELDIRDVKDILSSNSIKLNCEMEVFMAGIRWLKHDWSGRAEHRSELFQCVRFGHIAAWQLIDIKRNEDNLEFVELAQDPTICKLIDDGLAFVIVKYWYGQEHEDFQHWNTVLGLQEPEPRNWTGVEKVYFTYREFLIHLDQNRRNDLIQKSRPRISQDVKVGQSSKMVLRSVEPVRSMKNFGSTTKLKPKKSPKVKRRNKEETKQLMVFQVYTARSNNPRNPLHFLKQFTSQKPKTPEENEGREMKNVETLFTPSKNSLAKEFLNRLSASVLSPYNKKLLIENSLFLAARETILVFGGIDPYSPIDAQRNTGKNMYRYLPDTNVWEFAGQMPEPRRHHSVALMKGRIYLAGGVDPREDEIRGNARVVATVWSFDPAKRTWFSETSLGMRRKCFGLVTCQKKMYAIGGCNEESAALHSVERFCPKENAWKFVAPMKFGRAGVACAKYRNYIWAAGGASDLAKNIFSDAVESYDVRANQWTKIRSLNSPRVFSCMFVMSDKLYVIGGAGHKFKDVQSSSSMGSVDFWDTSDMSWKTILELTIPRHGHAVAYVGTQIFIMGGVTTVYTRGLSNTECFCSNRGVWVKDVACMPAALSGHTAVTLPPALLISNS